ncbi:uncharacterized protein LOC129610733 [Condylostylus longicornis]|uniref:uncharacterized protein LOC129610733 n=1 Tax=Condylostylus longicornis TaxID=2530218 RepID=UPI00244DE92D|nr:uncharacterized protein LOC129610733 [Condylostylus longicornis]
MSALFRLNGSGNIQNLLSYALRNTSRSISNSPKNRVTAATISDTIGKHAKTETNVSSGKPWMSYGFNHKDKTTDRDALYSTFFFSITLCIVWGTFIWSYLPDTQLRDWAQREGFLELRRREQAGLDLISPNYVDPATIELPTDDELANTEIII